VPGKTAWCARARKRQGTAAGDEVRAGHGVADRLPVAGQAECHPADAALIPAGGEAFPRLRKMAAIESARGSMEAAVPRSPALPGWA